MAGKYGDCSTCGVFLEMQFCPLCMECNCSVHAVSHHQKHIDLLRTTKEALRTVGQKEVDIFGGTA